MRARKSATRRRAASERAAMPPSSPSFTWPAFLPSCNCTTSMHSASSAPRLPPPSYPTSRSFFCAWRCPSYFFTLLSLSLAFVLRHKSNKMADIVKVKGSYGSICNNNNNNKSCNSSSSSNINMFITSGNCAQCGNGGKQLREKC